MAHIAIGAVVSPINTLEQSRGVVRANGSIIASAIVHDRDAGVGARIAWPLCWVSLPNPDGVSKDKREEECEDAEGGSHGGDGLAAAVCLQKLA